MDKETTPKRETDYLQYRGYAIPRFIRLAWTAMLIFGVVYLTKYMVPDLKLWLERLK